ncbi:MAG TPA: hypothetical protein VNI01_06065 [Elusimicrobiota bacterium]|jgi:hypothetical protein|nr:hypothetical protein [Elusimicrobiota bacterium]
MASTITEKKTKPKKASKVRREQKRALKRDAEFAATLQKTLSGERITMESDEKLAAEMREKYYLEAQQRQKQMEEDLAFARSLARSLEQGGPAQGGKERKLHFDKDAPKPAYIDKDALALSLKRGAKIEAKGHGGAGESCGAQVDDAEFARRLLNEEIEAHYAIVRDRALAFRLEGREAQVEADRRLAESLAGPQPAPRPEPLDAVKAGVHYCPKCFTPLSVMQDVNCGVFVCGATRRGQLAPHGGPAGEDKRIAGCGQQLKLQGDSLVACAGY